MTPEFSVIIPTRNRPDYLKQSVASVLHQKNASLELIIVNDGDRLTDGFDDDRVRILDNHSRGAVQARNFGVDNAHGKYIAFLDDDDFWIDRHHLEKSAAAFSGKADFYFANGNMLFPNGEIKPFLQNATAQSLEHDNTILISAVCYRLSIHQKLGRFDEQLPYYWDWDWYVRVSRGGFQFYHQNLPAVCIRVHPNNMSGGNVDARRANLDAMIAKHKLGASPVKNHTDFV